MPLSLTKSADVEGVHLMGREGVKLGSVREVYLDLAAGRIGFFIIETATLLGGAGKYRPVPWESVRYDAIAGAFQAQLTKDEFKAAPSYDREQLANPSHGWDEQSARYFSAPGLAGPIDSV